MNISDWTFSSRHLRGFFFETILTNKEGTTFGIIYQSQQVAPDAAIFEEFKKNPKAFFIEVSSEIVKRGRKKKPVLPKKEIKLLTNG